MKFKAKNGTYFYVAKSELLKARALSKRQMHALGTEIHTVAINSDVKNLFCLFHKDGRFQFNVGGEELTDLYPASAISAEVKLRIYSPNEAASNSGRGYWSTKAMAWVDEEKADEFGVFDLMRLGGLPESTGGDARSIRVN